MPRTPFRPRVEPLEARDQPAALNAFVVGGGPGGPPRVQVYDTATGARIGDFLAYENTFTGGVTAAVADVNNDTVPDVIVGAGVGGGPRVRVFDGRAFRPGFSLPRAPVDGAGLFPDGAVLADFFAFESSQRGGSYVAAGSFAGVAFAEVVVGAGPGGGPRVRVFDGQQVTQQGRAFTGDRPDDQVCNFFAFESSFRNGVTVAANPILVGGVGFSDLIVSPGLGGGPRVRVLDGSRIAAQRGNFQSQLPDDTIADFFAGDSSSRAGVYVASADFDRDGQADLAVGTGPGPVGAVTIYSGAAIRAQRRAFTGDRPGDLLDRFNPIVVGNYTNAVTVGAALEPGGVQGGGLLLVGVGGQGRVGQVQVIRFVPGAGSVSRQAITTFSFDPTFVGLPFVGE